jgi:hypothetical protein
MRLIVFAWTLRTRFLMWLTIGLPPSWTKHCFCPVCICLSLLVHCKYAPWCDRQLGYHQLELNFVFVQNASACLCLYTANVLLDVIDNWVTIKLNQTLFLSRMHLLFFACTLRTRFLIWFTIWLRPSWTKLCFCPECICLFLLVHCKYASWCDLQLGYHQVELNFVCVQNASACLCLYTANALLDVIDNWVTTKLNQTLFLSRTRLLVFACTLGWTLWPLLTRLTLSFDTNMWHVNFLYKWSENTKKKSQLQKM